MGFLRRIRNIFIGEERDVNFEIDYKKEFIVVKPSIEISKNDKILDLINMYNIEEDNNKLYIGYDTIYELYFDENNNEIDIYEYFNLPHIFKGFIRVENINNFIQDEQVQFSFQIEGYEGRYQPLQGNIIHCLITEELRVLPKKVYELYKKIVEYNIDTDKNRNVAIQFETLKIIKEYADDINIVLNRRLADEEKPIIIDKIKVDLRDDGEVLTILPKFHEDNTTNNELIDKIYQFDDIKDFYTAYIDGNKIKFVIKNKDSLNKVREHKTIRGEERLKVLSGDSPLFQDDNIDLSEFGPRVIGLGYLNYRSFPAMSKSGDFLWRETVTDLPHFYADSEKVTLHPRQLEDLKGRLNDMNEKNQEVTELAVNTEGGNIAKVIITKEQLKNEIIKLQDSILSPTEINNKEILGEIIEKYDEIPDDEHYIPVRGKYIEKYNKQFFIDRLNNLDSKGKGAKKRGKSLIILENIDKTEYSEDDFLYKQGLINAQLPRSLRKGIELFDYQKEALLKLQNLYLLSEVNGFLLCDDMGLGKTLQLLSFLSWLKERDELIPALIVAPSSLLNNWYNEDGSGEIQKFFKDNTFKTKKIIGRIDEEELSIINKCDIVLTTYDSLRINNVMLGRVQWSVMICDEAQKIKNPQTLVTVAAKAQNAKFKIVCTATPIENSLVDLWNLVDYSKPGVLGSLKEFESNYMAQIKNQDEKNLELVNTQLQNKINDYYIRREKDILSKALPPKKIKIYKTRANKYELEIIDNLIHSESNTLALIQKMLLVSNHPDLLFVQDFDTEFIGNAIEKSSKLRVLKNILKEIKDKNEKTIIFTRSIKIQQLIYKCIDYWFNMKVRIINGEVKSLNTRTKYLNEFRQKQDFNIIILSPDVAGFGITLTEANHVIHFTRLWNPAKEDQSTDRVYRIGQTKEVTVHHPILSFNKEDEIEFYSPDEYVEVYKDSNKNNLSPEEKLNILIARKKNMLLKFFLAVPDTEIGKNDFLNFRDNVFEQDKRFITMKDIENGLIDAYEFEALTATVFEKKGYTTFLTTKSNDNGVDVICLKDNEIILIQCKKVRRLSSIDTIKDLLYAQNSYQTYIPGYRYKLAVATNSIEIPEKIREWNGIKIFNGDFIRNELNNHKIYKSEIDIKNNDRYSFERLKLKL